MFCCVNSCVTSLGESDSTCFFSVKPAVVRTKTCLLDNISVNSSPKFWNFYKLEVEEVRSIIQKIDILEEISQFYNRWGITFKNKT